MSRLATEICLRIVQMDEVSDGLAIKAINKISRSEARWVAVSNGR